MSTTALLALGAGITGADLRAAGAFVGGGLALAGGAMVSLKKPQRSSRRVVPWPVERVRAVQEGLAGHRERRLA